MNFAARANEHRRNPLESEQGDVFLEPQPPHADAVSCCSLPCDAAAALCLTLRRVARCQPLIDLFIRNLGCDGYTDLFFPSRSF
jgi:hypothetical protein